MTHAVFGGSPTRPLTTLALSKWRNTVSAALSLRPSPSQIRRRSRRAPAGAALARAPALGLQVVRSRASRTAARGSARRLLLLPVGRRSRLAVARAAAPPCAASCAADGREEDDPEVVLDDVERHLAAAHRPLDEAHDRELRLVEHEAVARRRPAAPRRSANGLAAVVGARSRAGCRPRRARRGTARASAPCARRSGRRACGSWRRCVSRSRHAAGSRRAPRPGRRRAGALAIDLRSAGPGGVAERTSLKNWRCRARRRSTGARGTGARRRSG